MEKMEAVLREWQHAAHQMVGVDLILTMPELQPRDARLVPYKDRHRVDKASEEHVTRLHLALQASKDVHLEPLLVAGIDGGLYVLDGHHRLKAYKRAGRTTVPVRARNTTRVQAVILSKLVNTGGAKLAMTHEQSRDACWQYIAHVTGRGRSPCPLSARELAGRFGIGKDTANSMVHRIQSVDVSDFSDAACDPGTGWPRWRYVKQAVAKGQIEVDDPDAHREWRTRKDARKLADLFSKLGKERFDAALALLVREEQELGDADSMDALRRWSALQEEVTF